MKRELQDKKTAHNSTYKLAVLMYADKFVVYGYLVLRNYILAERRQLLAAANRYMRF